MDPSGYFRINIFGFGFEISSSRASVSIAGATVGYDWKRNELFVGVQFGLEVGGVGGVAQAGVYYNFSSQHVGFMMGAYVGPAALENRYYYDAREGAFGTSVEGGAFGASAVAFNANTDGDRSLNALGQAMPIKAAKTDLPGFGISPQAAESFLKTTSRVLAPALGAIYNSLDAAKWQDLWANARFHRFGPPMRTGWSGVQSLSLFFGGLDLIEPYAHVGGALTINQAQTVSATRGIRWTLVTYSAGSAAAFGFGVGGGPFSPASPFTAAGAAVLVGSALDAALRRAEDAILRWAGYPNL